MITLQIVEELAKTHNVVPVTKRLFAGTETPVGLYHKLCGSRPNTFLLESAEQGVWGRFSFIGIGNRGQLSAGDSASWSSDKTALPSGDLSSEPLAALRQMQEHWKSAPSDYPLTSGLVGFISWGLTEKLENLPPRKRSAYQLPLYSFLQFSELVIVDHLRSELVLVSLVFLDGQGSIKDKYEEAISKISTLEQKLREPTPALISGTETPTEDFLSNTTQADFLSSVEKAKDYVRIGDVFQVVISQRFDQDFSGDALDDEKERSEHLMLVDLSRNDLLRVCKPETLRVSEFMQIHRFSHVMHLVSTVEGELREGLGPIDALLSAFPAGTLSGAPKPRALEIINELENDYRGLFGGVVGYFDFAGNSDLAIAIRTTLIRDGKSHAQAGAGIVLDSLPESEYQETLSKAAVVIKAVARAKGF